jgi:hypothetical protein
VTRSSLPGWSIRCSGGACATIAPECHEIGSEAAGSFLAERVESRVVTYQLTDAPPAGTLSGGPLASIKHHHSQDRGAACNWRFHFVLLYTTTAIPCYPSA